MSCFTTAFIFHLFIAFAYCQNPSIEIVSPANAVVEEGESVSIRCTSGSGVLTVSLRINDDLAVPSNNEKLSDPVGSISDRTYTYGPVEPIDNNLQFSCSVDQVISEVVVNLTVLYAPIISSVTNGIGPEGGSASVTFAVDANPTVVESGVMVEQKAPNNTMIVNGSSITLTYNNLQRTDTRSYDLNVENSINSTLDTFNLTVYYFTNNGGSIEVTAGQPLSINCSVSDPALVSVTISGYNINDTSNGNNVFTITNATTSQYNGSIYTCTARNGDTMTLIEYTVTVVQPPIMPTTAEVPMPFTLSMELSSLPATDTVVPTLSPTSSGSSGLSTGAIVGIAIAAIVAIVVGIVLVAIGVLLLIYVIRKLKDVKTTVKPKQGVTVDNTKL